MRWLSVLLLSLCLQRKPETLSLKVDQSSTGAGRLLLVGCRAAECLPELAMEFHKVPLSANVIEGRESSRRAF